MRVGLDVSNRSLLLGGGRLPLLLAAAASVRGQTVLPAVLDRGGGGATEERAELQRTLEKNLPVLEAQSAVVKAAAKLIGPTAVHIKAEGPAHNSFSTAAASGARKRAPA